MPIFRLTEEIIFPPPEYAEDDGLLAVGGDLSEARLLAAYKMGIFPWYSEGSPILWWSPDPRLVLIPDELKVSRSLRQTLKKRLYRVTFDHAFDRVIRACAEIHRNRDGETWITGDMIRAYAGLHRSGYAHSVETWKEGELVGGLYGVALGGAFFGESMFAARTDASKVAFVYLARRLAEWKFEFIDCQVTTGHLISLGAKEMPRYRFLEMLARALEKPASLERWREPPSVLGS